MIIQYCDIDANDFFIISIRLKPLFVNLYDLLIWIILIYNSRETLHCSQNYSVMNET